MLEETEGIINNGQFGHMGNIGSKSQNEDKQKQKNARQKTKNDEQDGPHEKPWVNQGARVG